MGDVLNWLWQGCALTVVAAVAIRCSSGLSATTRYALWWVVLALVLLLPAVPALPAFTSVVTPEATMALSDAPVVALPEAPDWMPAVLLLAWGAWLAVSLLRIGIDLVRLHRARRSSIPFSPGRESRLVHWQALRQTGRATRLVVSDRVSLAAVFGFRRPLIALSPSAAAILNDGDLDRVVVHEWAHVQRRDDVARLAELMIRSIAGLHPAVWWIARRLEIEREVACDDHAVNVTGAPREFARCLTRLAEVPREVGNPALVPGALAASQLTARVTRLLDPRRTTSTRQRRTLLTATSALLAIGTILLARIELVAMPARTAGAVRASTTAMDTSLPARLDIRESPSAPPADAAPALRVRNVVTSPLPSNSAPVTRPAAPVNRGAPTMVETAPLARIERRVWPDTTLPPHSSTNTRDARTASPPMSGPSASSDDETPWGAAADAGIAIGRGSKKAGEAAGDGGAALGQGSQKAGEAMGDAGSSIGKGTQKAAVATAGFFSRMGRRIAGGS